MAETPKKATAAKPAAAADAEPKPDLTPAGASSDPRVHQILAERQTAVLNNDSDAIDACDQQLVDLGVTL